MKKKTAKKETKFWVLDTGVNGQSAGTFETHGPFDSQEAAETWICTTSSSDWLEACGCLRTGDPLTWGSTHIILREIRSVIPVPPTSVEIILRDV